MGETFEISTEDSKTLAISDSGYGSMVWSDEEYNWVMQAKEKAVDFLERMLYWFEEYLNFRAFDAVAN